MICINYHKKNSFCGGISYGYDNKIFCEKCLLSKLVNDRTIKFDESINEIVLDEEEFEKYVLSDISNYKVIEELIIRKNISQKKF